MPKLNIKALIFDFDLTLIDSKTNSALMVKEMRDVYGVSFDFGTQKEHFGRTFKINAQLAKNYNQTEMSADEIEEKMISICMKHFEESRLYNLDILKKWHNQGYKLAIVSGNTVEVIKDVLANRLNNCLDLFDPILETNSGITKAERLVECLQTLDFKKENAIYIGDHLNDVIAAKESGVLSCAVCTGFHTKDDFKELTPDIIISDLGELDKFLN